MSYLIVISTHDQLGDVTYNCFHQEKLLPKPIHFNNGYLHTKFC